MGRELLSILVEPKFPAPFLLSDLLSSNIVNSTFPTIATFGTLGKGSKKKSREKYGLLPNPGGGVSPRLMKKPNCFFGKVFFQ